MPRPIAVSEVPEFLRLLRPGDVILFDSLHPASHLIKLAENRPVNHVALYLGDAVTREVTAPHGDQTTAVQTRRLDERLDAGYDRTVTALRHHEGSATLVSDVLRAADVFAEQDRNYAFVDLMTLFIPGVLRSYQGYLAKDGEDSDGYRRLVRLTHWSDALLELVATNPEMSPGMSSDATLTCSEFIYRCFDGARPGSLILPDPLATWSASARLRLLRERQPPEWFATRGGGLDAAQSDDSDEPPFDFCAGIAAELDGTDEESAWGATRGVPVTAGTRSRLTRRWVAATWKLTQHNWARRKYGDTVPAVGAVLSDTVTPRDLWSSPSFESAAVLHLSVGNRTELIDDPH